MPRLSRIPSARPDSQPPAQLAVFSQFLASLGTRPPGPRGGDETERLLRRGLDLLLRALSADRAVVGLLEEDGARPILQRGPGKGALPLGHILAGLGEAASWRGRLARVPLAGAALHIRGARLALLCASRTAGAPAFTGADAHLLSAWSGQIGLALENVCLGRELERAVQESVASLVVTLEARHRYTEGHSLRVAQYAAATAEAMRLPPAVCEEVRTASLLHDLGKIGVRDAVLDKPGRLTEEEWRLMREHPVLGERILASLGFLAAEARVVRHHHERPDGRGYPDGLAGRAIPLPARILAVADAFDAMRTLRPYRPPLEEPETLAELSRGAGAQFDPDVVTAFQAYRAAA
jgi:putative nucleotidyltransferase with HDIG domain